MKIFLKNCSYFFAEWFKLAHDSDKICLVIRFFPQVSTSADEVRFLRKVIQKFAQFCWAICVRIPIETSLRTPVWNILYSK